jgi:CheY-like chemotaxis protein
LISDILEDELYEVDKAYNGQEAIDSVQKYHKKTNKLEKAMDQISKKYNTNFIVKIVATILVISMLVLFIIYRVIANPLKKLSKSVNW